MSTGVGSSSSNTSAQSFNPVSPEGHYSLNLAIPSERSVALQLCQLDQQSPNDLMKAMKLNGTAIPSAKKSNWPDKLPHEGVLNVVFERQAEARHVKILTDKEVETLVPQLQKKTITEEERLRVVSVICPQYYLHTRHAIQMLDTFAIGDAKVLATEIFFTRLVDAEEHLSDLLECLFERDAARFKEEMRYHLYFRARTPTGHYEFDFNVMAHRFLAARLMDLSRAELPHPTFRNIVYKTHADPEVRLAVSQGPPSFLKAAIPSKGLLSFDYLTFQKPPIDAESLSDGSLRSQLGLGDAERDCHQELDHEAMGCLKENLFRVYLTAHQAVEIIQSFQVTL